MTSPTRPRSRSVLGPPARQVAILAVVLVGVAAVIFVRREPSAPAGNALVASTPAPGDAGSATSPQVADLRLDALSGPRGELAPPERNPFRFEARQQPAPRVAAAPAAPRDAAPPVPAGPPRPAPIPLKFIGVLDAPTRIGTVAILSDSRGNVFYGKEGDIIEGRYRVLKIGTESAEVAYADGRGRQTIRLSGQ